MILLEINVARIREKRLIIIIKCYFNSTVIDFFFLYLLDISNCSRKHVSIVSLLKFVVFDSILEQNWP